MYPKVSLFTATTLLAALAAAQSTTDPVTGKKGNAPETKDNPVTDNYIATLPEKAFYTALKENIKGFVSGRAAADGHGVIFSIKFTNVPKQGGPFLYHLHDKPVPEDGNCTATGAHLDPYERGQKPACNPLHRETCEVGDLSGKWGSFTGDIETQFADLWTSTKAGEPGFFGNRSITLHTNNGTRITCANFKLEKGISGGDEGTDGGYGGGKNNSSTDDSSHTQTSTEEETSTKPPKGDATKGGDSANTNEKPGATKPSASDPSTAPPRNTGGTGSGEFSGASQVTLGSSAVLGAVVFIAGWFL